MKKNGRWIAILILVVIALTALPILLNSLDFTGADDAAGKTVAAVDPGYEPWAKPVIEFADKNTETLLFCLQAGIGSGILGLGFGYLVLRKKNQKG